MHQSHRHNPRAAQDPAHAGQPLPPRIRSLLGALRGSRLGIQDYREHLAEKYLGHNRTPRPAQQDPSAD